MEHYRTVNSDCCPDYASHCKGESLSSDALQYQTAVSPGSVTMPSDCQYGVLNISRPQCQYHGTVVREGDSVRDNCNTCKCEISETHQGCMDILCSTYQCVLETSVYEELEQGYQNGEWC